MKIAKASHKIIEAVVRTELVEVVVELSGELVDVVLSGEPPSPSPSPSSSPSPSGLRKN